MFTIAGCLGGAPAWEKDFFRTLPLTIFGYGSVGLAAAVIGIAIRRQPHRLTPYEATLLCAAILVYALSISHRWRNPRKRRHPPLSLDSSDPGSVSRTLKPGSRPFIVLGIIFSILLLLAVSLAISRGRWIDAAEMAACILAFYALLCFAVGWSRIIVTDDRLRFRPAFGMSRDICFRDIATSVPQILLEPDHPVALQVFSANTGEPVEIPLKAFRQKDIAWLLQLPQLRVRR
jgi:hypothetical protein